MTELLAELRIPRMGSVENATVVSWRIEERETFVAGQAICELETDKTVTELEAESAGMLAKKLAEAGDELKVGDLIALTAPPDVSSDAIDRALEARQKPASLSVTAAPVAVSASEASAPQASASGATPAGLERISPLVRRLAKEHGVDLGTVLGTGLGGKITGDDVLRVAGAVVQAGSTSQVPLPAGYNGVPNEVRPHSTRRKAIARRLVESARTAPHLTADMQIDLSSLLSKRKQLNAARQTAGQSGISLLAFIAQATANLLLKHGDLNATFTESHQVLWKTVNLGIGVDTPDGLVVPVIRNAERLSVEQLAAAIEGLAANARRGALKAQDLDGGTFTISNPGALGPVLRAEAVLNPPQVALLGLPGMLHTAVAVETSPGDYRVEVRPIIRPSLTFDHRALDGGHVIRFLNDLKAVLEEN